MLLTRQADIKSYPEEAVAECWKNRNGISRRANYTGFTISLRYRTSVIPPVKEKDI